MLAASQGRLDEPRRVVEVLAESVAPGQRLFDQRLDLERWAVHPRQKQVLVGKDTSDALLEHASFEQVLHA